VGFETISSVTLLMKETLVRVAEPALVPAGVREGGTRGIRGPAR
jgi:hypothetical protein